MGKIVFRPGALGEDNRANNGLFLISVLLLWGLGIFTLLISTTETASNIFKNQSKYGTLQGYIFAMEYAKLGA